MVLGHFLLGIGLALLLNREIRFRTFFRALLLLPWLFPEVVIANLWKWIFNASTGLLNSALTSLGLISEPMTWLGSVDLALPCVIFVCIWKGYPLVMIQMLAGLQSISKSLYEAATIDGANRWQCFRYVTLPGLAVHFGGHADSGYCLVVQACHHDLGPDQWRPGKRYQHHLR